MLTAAGASGGVLKGLPCLLGVTTGMGLMMFLVAFAYETTQTRQLIAHELEIFVATLLAGALVAGLLGVWMARRIVAGPKEPRGLTHRQPSRGDRGVGSLAAAEGL